MGIIGKKEMSIKDVEALYKLYCNNSCLSWDIDEKKCFQCQLKYFIDSLDSLINLNNCS